MGRQLLTEGAAFAHLFADCPCCGGQMSVLLRIQGNLAQVKAEHWNTTEKEADAGTQDRTPSNPDS